MKSALVHLTKFPSFKIVLVYAFVSAVYIYSSDYLLNIITQDINVLSHLQTYKGLGFIIITSVLLYVLVKRNINATSTYYQRVMDLERDSKQQLVSSKEEYMSLFQNSPLPMWLFDVESLRFLLLNDAACNKYGYSREEFLAMTIRDIRSALDIEMMEKALLLTANSANLFLRSLLNIKKRTEVSCM